MLLWLSGGWLESGELNPLTLPSEEPELAVKKTLASFSWRGSALQHLQGMSDPCWGLREPRPEEVEEHPPRETALLALLLEPTDMERSGGGDVGNGKAMAGGECRFSSAPPVRGMALLLMAASLGWMSVKGLHPRPENARSCLRISRFFIAWSHRIFCMSSVQASLTSADGA